MTHEKAPVLPAIETKPTSQKIFLPRRWVIAVGAIGFALIPVFLNPYYTYIATLALLYVLLAVGLNIVLGFAGQLVFANGVIFEIGAYGTGLLRADAGIPLWLALPVGTLLAVAIGVAVALPALRLRGLYLALATMAFAQFGVWVFTHWTIVTHGVSGDVIPPVDFSPLPVNAADGMFYLTFVIVIVAVALASNMLHSRIGRALVAIRASERAAEAMAIDVPRYKLLAYLVSSLFAGLSGGLFSSVVGAVVPDQFNLFQVVLQFSMVLIGGLGYIWGSVIGAVVIIGVQELLRDLRELQEVGFGVLLLITVLFFPGGLAAVLDKYVFGWSESLRQKDNQLDDGSSISSAEKK